MKKILFILLLPLTLFGQSQKISDMTSATTLAGTEYVPIVQTTNKKATVSLLRGFGSYGTAGQYMTVNGSADGFTFVTPPFISAYPGAGIAVSNGSAWGTSITDNSANWNTAFGWGNHAGVGYVTLTGVQTLTNKTLTDSKIRQDVRTETGTTYTIQASDEGLDIYFTNAADITVTLPNGLSDNFICFVYKKGTGNVILTATTTLEAVSNTIYVEDAGASVKHIGSNVWQADGALGLAITQYTDEFAQDAVGTMVDASLTYVDGTPLLQRAALTGAVTASAGSNTTSLGSFTKAQLNTAVGDGNVVYEGDVILNGSLSSTESSYTVTTQDPVTMVASGNGDVAISIPAYGNNTVLVVETTFLAMKSDGTASAFSKVTSMFRKNNSGTWTDDIPGTSTTSDAVVIATIAGNIQAGVPTIAYTLGAYSGTWSGGFTCQISSYRY